MGRRGRPPYPDILTPREFEVLDLLREGLSNEQIAERLGVSLAGAKFHVSEILGKLGVASREEAARWQPGRRPWWNAAFAPLSALDKHPLAAALSAVVLACAIAAAIGFLVWGLVRSDGDGASAVAPDVTPTVAPNVFAPTVDASATPFRPPGCAFPAVDFQPSAGQGEAVAPDVGGAGAVTAVTVRPEPSAPPVNVLRWCDADGLVQEQEFPAAPGDAFACNDCAVVAAVQQITDGVRELGVTYDITSLGSGSPTLAFALFRLEDGAWDVIWDSPREPAWLGYHGRAEFTNGDLSEVVVRRDDWGGVFFEANAGPHRQFVDTWLRQGDAYTRSSSVMVPAPYGSLIEFVTLLNAGDDAGARAWVIDASLIETARSFGLQDASGRNWLPACEPPTRCGETAPLRFYEGSGPAVAISFVEQDGRWLISAIAPAANQPFPN